jgi:hypothetical protein
MRGWTARALVAAAAVACAAGAGAGADVGDAATCHTPPEMFRSVRNETCLVTGISGMIGSYIGREVLDGGQSAL